MICLLVRKKREQLSYAAVNRSITEKAVCFAVSLNGADSGANRSEQLSKGSPEAEPQGQGAERWMTQQRRLGTASQDVPHKTDAFCCL